MTDPFRVAFADGPLPSVIIRVADGTILRANTACLELLGWPEDEFVGRTVDEVGLWARRERGGQIVEEVRTREGRTRTVQAAMSLVELDGEQCLVGMFDDITERHREELRLREREERLRQITETLQQAFWLRDTDPPEVLYANPGTERVFGVARDAFYRDPLAIEALIHPEDRETVASRRDAMTGPDSLEFRIVRPDGETRWIRSSSAPVRMADGRVSRTAAVSDDITEEKWIRDALMASERQFRTLVESVVGYAIVMLDREGRVADWNAAAERIMGYRGEEIVGSHFSVFYPPELVEARHPQHELDTAVAVGRYHEEGERIRKDGSRFWVDMTVTPVHDEAGAVRGFAKITRDITERKETEAVIARASEEAEQANIAKSEFLSRMSHELRTPLHAILGFGELLERQGMPPEQREKIVQITKGGRHLLDLINEVLDLSRIERGELSLSLEPVHAGQLLQEALELAAPLAAARSVIVVPPDAASSDIHVLADRQRLKQVLLNLLSNAVKYNREGGEVSVACTAVGAATVRFDVADTGAGIAAKGLARVFDPFERLGAEASDVEGTGLGLALSKRLVEAMDGEIGVESELGKGTRFWVQLAATAAPEVRVAPSDGDVAIASARIRGAARTVLYIEDNPSNIKLAETMLAERPEVRLIVATHGDMGVELAREHRPALVLLDLNLPDVSGLEVLRRMRNDARLVDTPIVVVSADATPGQVDRLLSIGADDYLTKPFGIEEFLAVIDSSGASASARRANRDEPSTGAGVLDRGAIRALHDLASRRSVGPAMVRNIVNVFLDDARDQVAALETAISMEDLTAIERQAHALRGASGGIGAAELATLCRRLESGAKQLDVEALRPVAARLGPALAETRVALEAEFR